MNTSQTDAFYTNMVLLVWTAMLALLLSQSYLTNALSSPTPSSIRIRICNGSSCESKCRGAFSPLKTLEQLRREHGDGDSNGDGDDHAISDIEFEETYCMNQCKRGPNARIIDTSDDDCDSLLIFEDPLHMNDTEQKRKSFQGLTNENRVKFVWGLARGVLDAKDEDILSSFKDTGASASKLSDIMPQKKS
mmetsp:Transcript_18958/g.27912  ORF Transcript_18958/g.27912 Transcript_18958/m.27912 type:complete len:191 (+) Transcript_18958:56-628(+)